MDWTTFVWMFVMLKIPIALLLWLIWYAIQEPEPETADDQDDGGSDRRHRQLPRHPGRRGAAARTPRRCPRRRACAPPPAAVTRPATENVR